jgi:hypothetical protein
MRLRPLSFTAVLLCVLAASCSSGPTVSEGDQHFLDAKNNLKSSDFKAAWKNLDATIKSTTNPAVKEEATVIRVALVTALADANKQMGEAYQIGAKQPAAAGHTGAFYKNRSDYYNTAHSQLMDAMQSVMDQRGKLGDKPLTIDVPFPGFTGTNVGLNNLKNGQLIGDNDRLQAELQADRNALAKVLTAMAGAKDDVNKGQEIYAKGKVELDPRVYLIALSESFLSTGTMFGPRGLNESDHLATVNQVVKGNLDAAEKLLGTKPDKDLEAQAKKEMDQAEGKPEKKGK